MQRSVRDALVGLLVTIVVGSGLSLLGGPISLAVVAGLGWGCAIGVTLHIAHRYPSFTTGESWADKRWTGLSVGVAVIGANLTYALTSLSSGLRLTLAVLVSGVGLVAYAAGTMAVLERTNENKPGSSVTPEPSSSDD